MPPRGTVTPVPMETFAFWGLAAVAVVTALLVVGQRNAVRALVTLVILLASVAGLFLLLSAPWAAAAQIVLHAGALLVIGLPALVFLDAPDEPGGVHVQVTPAAAPRRIGVVLVVLLAAELVWALRQIRAADMPSADALPDRGLTVVAQALVSDYPAALLSIGVLVVVAVAGASRLVRREIP